MIWITTRIYSLNFYFKRSLNADSIQTYIRGMKYINMSMSFKPATNSSNRIKTKCLKTSTYMIIREINHFMGEILIDKMNWTKNNKLMTSMYKFRKAIVKNINNHWFKIKAMMIWSKSAARLYILFKNNLRARSKS